MKDRNFIDLSQRRGYGSIYNNLAHGDSGGPIMRKINIDAKHPETEEIINEKRNVIVAIISKGTTLVERRNTKCVDRGTKVTQEMIKWIKKLDSGDYSLGKRINNVTTPPLTSLNTKALYAYRLKYSISIYCRWAKRSISNLHKKECSNPVPFSW